MAWVIDNQFSFHWKQNDKQEVPIQDFFQTECHDFGHLYIGLLFYLIILVSKYFGIKTQVNLLQQLNIMIDYRAKSTDHIRLNRVKLNGVLLIALRQRIEKFGKQKFYHSPFYRVSRIPVWHISVTVSAEESAGYSDSHLTHWAIIISTISLHQDNYTRNLKIFKQYLLEVIL